MFEMKRIEKSWEDLDFTKVNFQSSSESDDPEAGHWGWGRGGGPLKDQEFSISHVDEKLVETRYKMPPCINEMLINQRLHGAEEAKGAIKRALDI